MTNDDEIAYFSVRWKIRKLVWTTAPNQEPKPMSRVETEKGPH